MLREALGIDRRRGHHDAQLGPACDQALHVTEQEIDAQAALVRFIQDDRAVLAELAVALRLGEEDAVGHELHRGACADLVVEAHLAADDAAELGAELLGNPRGDRARGDAPRLRVANAPALVAAHLEQHLRQLRRLARAGLAADDHHRISLDGGANLLAPRIDGQCGVESDAAHGRACYFWLQRGYER